MQKSLNILIVCLLLAITGCGKKHLIDNKVYLSKVEQAFEKRKQLSQNRSKELFSVLNNNLSPEQAEAFKFLIAYSPLNDLADYSGDFFMANIDIALKTRKETLWGMNTPEAIFLHYILPFRINNENLDSFRIAYYQEIKNRIKGLDPAAASLEINHWCHEKVSYQPADIRTSGPMSTILSARGRCGEESTFTVAALRTAGIPARQVYTPRWAHSDDNHAWVEVWIDGSWYYMGACEPEPTLDRGWFTEPARRAMLIHTKSFGEFTGDENAVKTTRNFAEINNLAKYAVTKEIIIRVLDSVNSPVSDAIVEYQLYNYAEFYPLAMVPTDGNGLSRFETGLGDLLIWARKDNAFNFRKISVNDVDTVEIKLDRRAVGNDILEMDLGVPVVRSPLKGPDAGLINTNNKRVADENNIRQKYIDTWMKPAEAEVLAVNIGADTKVVIDLINRSMGNYESIRCFLETASASGKSLALNFLSVISDKDLRDTRAEVLKDHLDNVVPYVDLEKKVSVEVYNQYILNPRIANEILSKWREYLLKNLPENIIKEGVRDPAVIISYLDKNIIIADDENYYKTPLTPRGVIELKVSDSFSRDICFVAICRSLGVPSRLEPGSNVPQYFIENNWRDAFFSYHAKQSTVKGFLKLTSNDKNPIPEYYSHFTIARFEKGRYNTLEYDYNKRVTDFKDELSLAPGHYMVVTGNRISDSKILSNISFFSLKENEHKTINIEIRKDASPTEILGTLDLKTKILKTDNSWTGIDTILKNGMVMLWIEPEKEPTKHIFNDLPLLKTELDSWGGYFVFLTDDTETDKNATLQTLKGLPQKSLFGTDKESAILKKIINNVLPSEIRLPYIILVDKRGNIIFRSEGYRIGIGEQILKKVR